MNNLHYTWLGDIQVLNRECAKNSLNPHQGPFSGDLRKIKLSEYKSSSPGVLRAHKITTFQAFLPPPSWCSSATNGCTIRLVVVPVEFPCPKDSGLSE